MRTVVFGDTGGHTLTLVESLVSLGMSKEDLVLPEGLQVVHLGDLIHKGPHSNEAIMIVNAIMERNPGRWHQLLGNHEFNYFQGAPSFWHGELHEFAWKTLQKWQHKGLAKPSFFLPAGNKFHIPKSLKDIDREAIESKGILFSHAGLTKKFWKYIGEPETAEATSEAINALSIKEVTRPGIMLETMSQSHNPGPVWALSTGEVFVSWDYTPVDMPFNQVHGHTAPYHWPSRKWYGNTPLSYKQVTKLDVEHRISYTSIHGKALQIGCDPGYSEKADLEIQPYLEFNDGIII